MASKKEVAGKSTGRVGIFFVIVSAIGLLQACATVGPDYKQPELETPDLWHQQLVDGLAEGEASLQNWWTVLNDPTLDSLIERATKGNLDLKEAFARIKEARALRGVATGERYPDINGDGFVERNRTSDDFLLIQKSQDNPETIAAVGLDATWEIDFWGRITRSIESADAGLQASLESYRDVLVVLYSEIALNYVQVRTLQARIRFAKSQAESQRGTLEITKARLKAEISGELDVRRRS